MVEELDHVAIAVRDLEAWTRRFEVLLGRPVSFHLRDAGEGVYLIAVRVDDLEATLARLREAGVRLVGDPGPGRPLIGHVFIHPKDAGGVMIQLTPRAQQEPA
jgi:catechol 2,3-dioxygenase-like lactoylglutathione lyase family enzyme